MALWKSLLEKTFRLVLDIIHGPLCKILAQRQIIIHGPRIVVLQNDFWPRWNPKLRQLVALYTQRSKWSFALYGRRTKINGGPVTKFPVPYPHKYWPAPQWKWKYGPMPNTFFQAWKMGGRTFFEVEKVVGKTFLKVEKVGARTFLNVYDWSLVVFLNREIPQNPAWVTGKFRSIWMEISMGPWRICNSPDTGQNEKLISTGQP